MGAHKNRLIETVLMSTHNIMFWMRKKENNFPIHTLIWRPVIYIPVNVDEWLSSVNMDTLGLDEEEELTRTPSRTSIVTDSSGVS